jgi:hypothetical protein
MKMAIDFRLRDRILRRFTVWSLTLLKVTLSSIIPRRIITRRRSITAALKSESIKVEKIWAKMKNMAIYNINEFNYI